MPKPEFSAEADSPFSFGQMTPLKFAFEIAQRDIDTYVELGGNPDLFSGGSTYQKWIEWSQGMGGAGGVPGPLEQQELDDALNVAPRLVDDWPRALAIMQKLNLQKTFASPLKFVPAWTPEDDAAAIVAGLKKGAGLEDVLWILPKIGYPSRAAADLENHLLSSYNLGIGSQEVSSFAVGFMQSNWLTDYRGGLMGDKEAECFIDPATGYIISAVTANAYALGYGSLFNWVPFDAATGKTITSNIVYQLKPKHYGWVHTIELRLKSSGWGPAPGAGMVAYQYLANSYRWRYGDPTSRVISFLDMALNPGTSEMYLTRWDAVPIEAAALVGKAVAGAKQNKLVYGLFDMISPTPIDPATKLALKESSFYNPAGHFPTMLQTFVILGYSGINPLGLVGEPGVVPDSQSDFHGKPNVVSVMGLNQQFDYFQQSLLRSRIAFWTVAGGYKCVNMGWSGAMKGDVRVPSEFGVLIAYVLNAGETTRAFPYFEDTVQYGHLSGALEAGLTDDRQLANTFEGAIGDPALMVELGAVRGKPGEANRIVNPDVDVTADFRSNPNLALIMDAWLRTPQPPLPKQFSKGGFIAQRMGQ